MEERFKPYRIRHNPTGLYFSPYSTSGNNLTKRGKIYTTKTNGFREVILLHENSIGRKILLEKGYKETTPIYPYHVKEFIIPREEFEKEYL